MRCRFAEAGLPAPSFELAHTVPGQAEFPCVLKPLSLSGSRGVIRANNRQELEAAFDRIRRILEIPTPRFRSSNTFPAASSLSKV